MQFSWGADTINTVRFNQTEVSVLASCGTDRNVVLYDVRYNSPLSKIVMNLKGNALAWNPMEAFNFCVANEDHNCYMFDMRRMDKALNIYKDHVSAVYSYLMLL
jgi:WD repeat and SOF domain-containing protein 1